MESLSLELLHTKKTYQSNKFCSVFSYVSSSSSSGNGHLETVKCLVKAGADLGAISQVGLKITVAPMTYIQLLLSGGVW